MNSEADQALLQGLQPHEEAGFRKEMQNDLKLRHLIISDTLKYAVKIFTSNTNFAVLVILSFLPFFVFMVFYELRISELVDYASYSLVPPYIVDIFTLGSDESREYDANESERKQFRVVLELFPFYWALLPLVELFSFPVIINVASKIYAGESQSSSTLKDSIKEVFFQQYNLKGHFKTLLWVQLLSTCTVFGLFWTVVSHQIIAHHPSIGDECTGILSAGFHAVIFLGLLYKFLEWSALWNMAMVVSLLHIEHGVHALEMSAYYGKHSRRTRFQLMLVFFIFSVVLRLPFVVARVCDVVSVGIVVTIIVVALVCSGSLVKWVAIVSYFYNCKARVLLKKADEEVRKVVKTDEL